MAGCSEEDGHEHLFKLLIIGASGVGKSSLITRFTRGKFKLEPKPTTANSIVVRHVYIDGKVIKAQIVDISGNHRYRSFNNDIQVQNACGVLIVYDVTKHSTFENVEKWYRELHNANGELEFMLIGNKSDLKKDTLTTSTEAGKAFAERTSISFTETSAKDDINVEKAFAELATLIFQKVTKNVTMDIVETHAFLPPLISSEAWMSRSSGKDEPSHYMLKIESFSLLSGAKTNKIESGIFEASGYKWRLELYPNGNKEKNASNYISVYMSICETENLPKGWEVFIEAKICVYDHLRQNYVIFQDVDRKRTRLHEKKLQWGFSKLISLASFSDARNGCLFHDSCVLGAEVFVVSRYAGKDQCLSMIKPPAVMNTYTWTVEKFSSLTEDKILYSDYFKVGKVKWKLLLCPKGNGEGEGTHLSIFLKVHNFELLSDGWKVYAKYEIRLNNQAASADRVTESEQWFDSPVGRGTPCFMLLSELDDLNKGFLVDDSLTVEAEFSVVAILKDFN